ncbi:phosphotransferase family protein [Agrococcus terreus]|uniref:Phosphotransferase n=1 Tax=Agrococcus terreus TaxID=574649 RepID=A0ABQ2KIF5_9MICO|nr:phosphotransferase [Agrococcus terreus]GGN83289.1 phosphotransferase [Agrococcus terreus]
MVAIGFAAPEEALVEELVLRALRSTGARSVPRDRWERIDHGSANVVVLVDAVAVRVSRSPEAASVAARAQRLIDRLPPLPFELPRSLGAPVRLGGLVAIPQRRVVGASRPAGEVDAQALASVLDAFEATPLDVVEQELAEPWAFAGGRRWHASMVERAIPLLPLGSRARATRAADRLAEASVDGGSLVHGDLAGANLVWDGGRIAGVLDWDLASASDPAIDVAALATWFGWDTLGAVRPAAEITRARAVADTYPLQQLSFAILRARPQRELEPLLRRAAAAYAP